MKIAVLNAGSGSGKCSLFDLPDEPLPVHPVEPVWEAKFDSTAPGQPEGQIVIKVQSDRTGENAADAGALASDSTPGERAGRLLRLLWEGPHARVRGPHEIDAVGHRVVHGGDRFTSAALIDATVEAAIERFGAMAPLHNPVSLSGLHAARELFGDGDPTRHFAVFDTAFHHTLPLAHAAYAGPYAWLGEGIRRYGFHGTSFRWAAEWSAHLLGRAGDASLRLIVCHLGGGCSLCATHGGQSLDTTMGFTPLDGLAMCTRSGSVDPGILFYLLRQGWKTDELERLLNKDSGLKGLSGLSGDTRVILPQAEAGHAQAALARDVFVHRVCTGIGQMLASLGDLPDALVFTDAISEDEPAIRRAICAPFGFLGLHLDESKNAGSPLDTDLATAGSRVRVLLLKSREAWQIAREGHALLSLRA